MGERDDWILTRSFQSDANYRFYADAQEKMFPGTAYAHSSGGDPPYITDLTHQQLVKFHQDHYHPSNARFFTYGKLQVGYRPL